MKRVCEHCILARNDLNEFVVRKVKDPTYESPKREKLYIFSIKKYSFVVSWSKFPIIERIVTKNMKICNI